MTHSGRSGGQMVLAPASKPSLASSPTARAAPPQRLLTTLAGWSGAVVGARPHVCTRGPAAREEPRHRGVLLAMFTGGAVLTLCW